MKSHSLKITLLIALIAVVILAVSPKVIGVGIQEATIGSLIELIPPETESQLEINQGELSSGWFSSTSSMEVLYTGLGTDSIALELEFEISHGPLMITADGPKFGLAYATITPSIRNDAFEVVIADFPFDLPRLSLNLLAGFDQSLVLGLNIDALNYSGNDGLVDFEGVDASFVANSDQSAEFKLTMGALTATENSANSNLSISGLELLSSTAQMNDILAQSQAQLSIPAISSSAPISFSVTDFSTTYGLVHSAGELDHVNIYQNMEIADISSAFPLRSLLWKTELNEINSELFSRYYQLLIELQDEMNSNPELVTARITQLGEELALIVAQNSLVFNNFVQTNLYEGDHELDLKVQWAGQPDLSSIAALNLNEALLALTVEMDVSLDLEAVLRSPAAGLIDPYVQQGYLEIENGKILIQTSLKDGVLILNDDTLPLDQLF